MAERLVRVEGSLTPAPLAAYSVTYSTRAFEVELDGSALVARPKPGLDLDVDAGLEKLEEDLDPLLSSLAVESGWAVGVNVTHAEFVEDGPSVATTMTRSFPIAQVDAVIVSVTSGSERRRLLLARIDWATRDSIYRDLLDFFAEAKGAANPRPALTSLWERLEAKYGTEDVVKGMFSITRAELRAIKGDQHGSWAIGTRRTRRGRNPLGSTRRPARRRSPAAESSSRPMSGRSSARTACRSRLLSRARAGRHGRRCPKSRRDGGVALRCRARGCLVSLRGWAGETAATDTRGPEQAERR